MNKRSAILLRKNLSPHPSKALLDELVKMYDENLVTDGKLNLMKCAKIVWNSKNAKEKAKWKQQLA